jgi:Na+/proline symporter
LEWGILIVAAIGTGYTIMGGMWSVTLIDAVQIVLVIAGLIVMAGVVLLKLGEGNLWAGLERIGAETDPDMLIVIPTNDAVTLLGWIGVFAIGALGNIPGQDLLQRVFASNSERTAKYACYVSGVLYLIIGAIPLLLALAGNLLFPQSMNERILPAMTQAFLHPALAVVFLLALLSAILSTIASAILSPASVMAQNILPRFHQGDTLKTNRLCVLFVAYCSVLLAYLGGTAYELLEDAYLLTLVGMFVPLMIGLYSFPKSGKAAMASMLVGMGLWFLHFVTGWEKFLEPLPGFSTWKLPFPLAAPLCSLLAYFVFEPPWKIAWSQNAANPEDSTPKASSPGT